MTATSYYTIIKNCLSGDYADSEDMDKETIRDFLLSQLQIDLSIGELFMQEVVDLRRDIITMLT
jgi:hypothetical protein